MKNYFDLKGKIGFCEIGLDGANCRQNKKRATAQCKMSPYFS